MQKYFIDKKFIKLFRLLIHEKNQNHCLQINTKMDSQNNKEHELEVVIKKPKRVLHCSDGIYEEYSDDEDTQEPQEQNQTFPWRIAQSVINALDYAGETLGEFFHITTPKYSYEIEQFKKEQEQRAKEEALERDNTWDIARDIEKSEGHPVTQVPSKNLGLRTDYAEKY